MAYEIPWPDDGADGRIMLSVSAISRILGNSQRTPHSESLSVVLDALNLMQGFRIQIALSAGRATDRRHTLNDQNACSFAVTAGNMMYPRRIFAAYIALQLSVFLCVRHHVPTASDSMRDITLGRKRPSRT